ncbi:toprim domain-containing protein [Microbispora sp. H10949]|uniref:toprim domain-containing protein n=1 Tax=Microbispora sp. H10949 TaxID=2729111 RepID=UPI0015FED219|nr:toprim domain-containing protein [Microbispora sp. H10949]
MLINIHRQAELFFQACRTNSWVPAYLRDRGFDLGTQRSWRVGYAPNDWRALTRHLRTRGFSDTAIEQSGLARRTNRGMLIDFFRDRVMLPIKDPDGATIAFVARSRDSEPKYLKSPRTPLYAKGRALFGVHTLTADLKPVIAEGPLDAIAISAVCKGQLAGVSPCGTALTSEHVAALRAATALTNGVVIAFDGDSAGRTAAVHSYALFKNICTAEAVVFSAGQDPAGVLRDAGPDALAKILHTQARPLADLVTDTAIEPWQEHLVYPEGRLNTLRSAGKAISAMAPADVARQVARVADRLDFDHAAVTETVADFVTTRLALADFPTPPTINGAAASPAGRKPSERSLRGPTP